MTEITGIVEKIEENNLYLRGHDRPYFALESSRFHLKEYQPGDGARIVIPKKGEFSAIFPWTPPEGWKPPMPTISPPGDGKAGAPAVAGGPAGTSPQGGPGTAQPAPPREDPGKPKVPPNKDQLIVRQTCIKAAVDLLSRDPAYNYVDEDEKAAAITGLAEKLESWVWRLS
jgi:hypothetical protein